MWRARRQGIQTSRLVRCIEADTASMRHGFEEVLASRTVGMVDVFCRDVEIAGSDVAFCEALEAAEVAGELVLVECGKSEGDMKLTC